MTPSNRHLKLWKYRGSNPRFHVRYQGLWPLDQWGGHYWVIQRLIFYILQLTLYMLRRFYKYSKLLTKKITNIMEKLEYNQYETIIENHKIKLLISRWYRGNVLVSRSKVRGFKPGWGRWIFSGRKSPEHKSSGRGSQVWDFRLTEEPKAWKIGLSKT